LLQGLSQIAGCHTRIAALEQQFLDLLANLFASGKLHNVPALLASGSGRLEPPGASFFHQDMSFPKSACGFDTV
jgi:hypothetical protein